MSKRSAVLPRHDDRNGWWEILPNAAEPAKPAANASYRTVIIGAGICGLSTARRLGELRPGETIAVLDAEPAGFSTSGRNAGVLFNLHSHGKPKDIDVLKRNSKLWVAGLSELRTIVRDHQIQCDWSDWGRLYASAGEEGEKYLDEIAATLTALDMPFEWRDRDRLRSDLGTDFYLRSVHVPGSALVNPAAMMRGLAATLPANVDLFEDAPVLAIDKEQGQFRLSTPDGEVRAEQVIVATGIFMRQLGIARGRYVPMATYASLTEQIPEDKMSMFGGGAEFGLLPSSANGATVRLTRDRRLFVRNVVNFMPGLNPDPTQIATAKRLHRGALVTRWPELADLDLAYTWGGVMAFTTNDGAVFGELEPNLYAILTNDVSPMTRGAISGRLLAELIEGQDSDLLGVMMSFPHAQRLVPRPILDLGIAWKLNQVRRNGAKEF